MDTPGSTPRSSARCWLPVALLGLALGATVAAMPAPAQAADVQVRVLVDVADLVFRSGRPYYYDEGYYLSRIHIFWTSMGSGAAARRRSLAPPAIPVNTMT